VIGTASTTTAGISTVDFRYHQSFVVLQCCYLLPATAAASAHAKLYKLACSGGEPCADDTCAILCCMLCNNDQTRCPNLQKQLALELEVEKKIKKRLPKLTEHLKKVHQNSQYTLNIIYTPASCVEQRFHLVSTSVDERLCDRALCVLTANAMRASSSSLLL
jgi:hypothetical protein